jgi:hypothetical protein
MHGRPAGELAGRLQQAFAESGYAPAPPEVTDDGRVIVERSALGFAVALAALDSVLVSSELVMLRRVMESLVPMGEVQLAEAEREADIRQLAREMEETRRRMREESR